MKGVEQCAREGFYGDVSEQLKAAAKAEELDRTLDELGATVSTLEQVVFAESQGLATENIHGCIPPARACRSCIC